MSKKKPNSMKGKRRLFEGLPVVDAVEDVSIVITPTDVKNSKVKNPGECAAALAGRRELHREVRVFVSRMYVKDKTSSGQERWIRFVTPENISREIVSFDRGASFEPGEYSFKAPSKASQLGAPNRGSSNTGKGTKHRPRKVTANIRENAKSHSSTGY